MSSEDMIVVLSENGVPTKQQIKRDNVVRLEDVNWMVNVSLMSDSHRDSIQPRAVYQLKTTDQNAHSSTSVMDFKLPELTKFYETLEKIQDALDDLHK